MVKYKFDRSRERYTQDELCQVAGIDDATANNWVSRHVIHVEPNERPSKRGRRMFTGLEVYRARLTADLVRLGTTPATGTHLLEHDVVNWARISWDAIERGLEIYAVITMNKGRLQHSYMWQKLSGPSIYEGNSENPFAKRKPTLTSNAGLLLPISATFEYVERECAKLIKNPNAEKGTALGTPDEWEA